MDAPGTETVTLGEIGRRLVDLAQEVRALRAEHVRRDLYDAHRAATEAAISSLDRRHESEMTQLRETLADRERERQSMKRLVMAAVLAAGLSLLTQLLFQAFG